MKYDYWIFYIDKNIRERVPNLINKDTLIYAYTDDEGMVSKFGESHDMNNFVLRKNHLTQQEVHYLSKTERDKYITERKILTKGKHGNKVYVKICLTLEENKITRACTSSKVMEYVYKHATKLYPKEIFNKDVRELLNLIGVFDTAEMFAGLRPVTVDSEKLIFTNSGKDTYLYVDELAIFSNVFYPILKVGE